MKNSTRWSLLGILCLTLATAATHAEVLTVNSILTAQKAGAPSDGIVAMVNDPSNTVGMSAGDLVTLRDAGVSEAVITAVWARVLAPAPAPMPAPEYPIVDERILQATDSFDLADHLVSHIDIDNAFGRSSQNDIACFESHE